MKGRTVSRCVIAALAPAFAIASVGSGCSFHTPDSSSVPLSQNDYSGSVSSSSGGGNSVACTPHASSFLQYYKCTQAISLGDQGSEAACLNACLARPDAHGCWYLDGTGGFARDCRICTNGPPVKQTYPNDWGAAITCVPSSSSGTSSSSSSSTSSTGGSTGGTCMLGAELVSETQPATCSLQCPDTDPMGIVNSTYCAQPNLSCCCFGGGLSWRCVGCPSGTTCGTGANAGKCCY